jgi:iron complex outermembrane recepter protein
LECAFFGYQTQEVEVTLTQNHSVSVTLLVSMVQLPTVVLTAIKARETMPFAQTNISLDEVEQRNVGQDMPFLLEQTPSFIATSETGYGLGYTNMRIRGTDISRINVTVNGVPLNDPESHGVFWVNMTDFTSSVQSMQIQRGVGTSTNGAASFGASVNIETMGVQEKPGVRISSTVGAFNTVQGQISGTTGIIDSSFSFSARYSKLHSDGYVQRGFSNHESMHVSGSFFKNKHSLTGNVMLGKQRTGITWEGIADYMLEDNRTYNVAGRYVDDNGKEQFYEDETDNYWQNHYTMHYNYKASPYLTLSSNLFLITGKGYYEQYKTNQRFNRYGIEPILIPDSTLTIGDKTYEFSSNSITRSDIIREKWLENFFYGYSIGATYEKDKITASIGNSYNIYSGDHFGHVTWVKYAPDLKPFTWYQNTGVKTDANVFAKIQYQISKQLSVFADAQQRIITYEMNGIDDDLYVLDKQYAWNFFNPKAGMFYTIDSKNSLFASYGVSNREPARSDLREVRDSTLLHETLHNIEIGYQYRSQKIAYGINLYNMNYDNQLVLTGKLNEVGAPIKENVAQSYRRGIEFIVGVRPAREFEWNANLSLSQNKIQNYVEYAANYDENWDEEQYVISRGQTDISYSPNIIAGNSFMFYPHKSMSFGLTSKYVGAQFFDNTSNEERKLDAYLIHNFQIQYVIPFEENRSLRLQLYVNNLFDKLYESNAYGWNWYEQGEEKMERFYFPQAGLHSMLKVTLDL